MNYANVCRRLTPILLVGCLALAAFASTLTILSLRRSAGYQTARLPVEERRRALQEQMDRLQQRLDLPAESDSTEGNATPSPEEKTQLTAQIESFRRERYALYDQRRAIMAQERGDLLLRFHDSARLPLINLQILCLGCLVASRLLEMALASAPQRSPLGAGGASLRPSLSPNSL